ALTIVAPADWVNQALVSLLSHPDDPRSVDIDDVPAGAAGFVDLLDPLSQLTVVGAPTALPLSARVVLLNGTVVSGAEVELVVETGRPRCFATAGDASAFASQLSGAMEAGGVVEVEALLVSQPDRLLVTSNLQGVASVHCVASP